MTMFATDIARRRLLHLAGLGAASVVASPLAAREAMTPPLTRHAPEQVRLAAVQSHAGSDQAANLAEMLRRIDHIQSGEPKDLIVFHAAALHGPMPGTIDAARRAAVSMSGPEIAALAGKAKQHRVHIAFSALTADADWHGHVIARQILVGSDGSVILAAWQAAHDPARAYLTSVETVLDRFVEMYGRAAVLPVVATAIGNIALTLHQAAPDIDRALALKGAEIIVRAAEASSARWDAQACAAYNGCTVVAPAPAASLHDEESVLRGGGSLIVGPRGEIIAEAGSRWDQTLSAVLPAAYNRSVRPTLNTHAALTAPTELV